MAGQPAYYSTPDELKLAIEQYFNSPDCDYTITGLCFELGFCSRQSFYDYEERPEYSYIIKRARLIIERMYERKLSTQTVTGAIFALKNMGWKDKQEIEQSGGLTVNWHEQKTYGTE